MMDFAHSPILKLATGWLFVDGRVTLILAARRNAFCIQEEGRLCNRLDCVLQNESLKRTG
jgi:hypothetical protein